MKKNLTTNYYLPTTILGIDPGFSRMGIAIINKNAKGEILLHSECFETDSKLHHSQRLFLVAEKLEEIIEKFKPEKMAIETLLFSKNAKTAMRVAEARGVILATAAKNKLKIIEYNPNTIKLAVTGYGKSDKKQIISMIHKILKVDREIKHDDEYDAIAIALTSAAISLSTEKFV